MLVCFQVIAIINGGFHADETVITLPDHVLAKPTTTTDDLITAVYIFHGHYFLFFRNGAPKTYEYEARHYLITVQ